MSARPPHPLLLPLRVRMGRLLRGLRPPAPLPRAAPLGPREVRALLRRVVPREPAPWQAVGWETDFAAARARAEREGRPLFLWVMDGHPLGAT